MNRCKKALCLTVATLILFGLCGCKNDKIDTQPQTESTTSVEQQPDYYIGNTTVVEIMNKLDKLTLNDDLKLKLTEDKTETEFHSAKYAITDAKGKKLAYVIMRSDIENKASLFDVSWDYEETTSEQNKMLVAASKTLIIAAWPEYKEEYIPIIEKFIRFETDYLNALKGQTTSHNANAVDGMISSGMSDGIVYYSITYPNIVENI